MTGRSVVDSDPASRLAYQPALDGLRGVSVCLVVLYHAGFTWMRGGFFGVEVFFVVSGFLITALLLAEHDRTGTISLRDFWRRRARRLFPALGAVLLAVTVWTALWGSAEQISQVRRDVPWAVFYVSNWGQILGDVPYFAGEPPMLRHLWSLGVEEQWYLVWPLAVAALLATRLPRRALIPVIGFAALAAILFTAWLETRAPTPLGGPPALFEGVDRTNFMYLSTLTRVSGLLLGAAGAVAWGMRHTRATRGARWRGDLVGAAALSVIVVASVVAVITEGYIYTWLLPVVSLSSLVVVLAVLQPGRLQRLLSLGPVVVIGTRSYGLYLWSWPIFVIAGATDGSWWRFAVAMVVAALVTEASYRYLERPVRDGRLRGVFPSRLVPAGALVAVALVAAGVLTVFYASADDHDPLARAESVELDADRVLAADSPSATTIVSEAVPATSLAAPVAPTEVTTTVPDTPRQATLAIVGDSQGNAFTANLPRRTEELFPEIVSGSLDGCSVWDSGAARGEVELRTEFPKCVGWQEHWAASAENADVAVVLLGAWDVFDIVGETSLPFGSGEFDEAFTSHLRSGVTALRGSGARVALLEVPCMRPIDVEYLGAVAYPERGDDERVAHLNALLRATAEEFGPEVRVVEGPRWCEDDALAGDVDLRWDGIHLGPSGVRLVLETVALDLLDLAAT